MIARRLNQLSKEDRTIERLVKDAMAGTAELTANLEQRRADLQTQRTQVQVKIDALVESIADRRNAEVSGEADRRIRGAERAARRRGPMWQRSLALDPAQENIRQDLSHLTTENAP